MRNLKKVLSLVLVFAMVLALGVSASAASLSEYKDVDKIENEEAVAVMSAIGVLEGTNGVFNPDKIVTREQAAKIVCYMLMGEANAEKLSKAVSPFADVAAGRWSAGYINYCKSKGIISGVGKNKFEPEGELTGVQFAKIMLTALGYDAEKESMVGASWVVNTANLAINEAKIAGGIADLSAPMTRQDAAQMAFNTLTADLVKYKGGTNVSAGDVSVIVNSERVKVGDAAEKAADSYTGAADTPYTQFCEQYFKTLKLVAADEDDADAFGRTASTKWTYDKSVAYKNASKAVVTYTEATSADQVAKDLKGYKATVTPQSGDPANRPIDNSTAGTANDKIATIVTKNGAAAADLTVNTDKLAAVIAAETGNGKVVEIYADNEKVLTSIVEITYTVETVNGVKKATNGDVTYTLSVTTPAKTDYADAEKADTVAVHGTVEQGDVVTTVTSKNVTHIYPTTMITGAQSSFNTKKETITVDGKTYPVGTGVATAASSATPIEMSAFNTNSANAANFFIDQYGFVVKTDAISQDFSNYAMIVSYVASVENTLDAGQTPKVTARFVLTDGSVADYDVKLTKNSDGAWELMGSVVLAASGEVLNDLEDDLKTALAANTVFAYSLSDNTITLKAVADSDTAALNAGDVTQNAAEADIEAGDTATKVAKKSSGTVTVLLDKNTKYIVYDANKKSATASTGALPAGTTLTAASTAVVSVANSATVASGKVVFAWASEKQAEVVSDYAYVDASEFSVALVGNEQYVIFEATKADGTTVELYDKYDNADGTIVGTTDGLYTWSVTDGRNYIAKAFNETNNAGVVLAKAAYTVVGSQMIAADGTTVYNIDAAKIVYIDGTKTEVDSNQSIVVLEVVNGQPTKNVEAIFVVG